jgi:hypothetical protein
MTLYSELSDLLTPSWGVASANTTTYRGFYRIYPTKIGKPSKGSCIQARLERKRPLIDYIQLPDHSLLIGYSRDFKDMKQAAIELTMQYLLDETKRHKAENRKVLSSLEHITKQAASVIELTPEEFL